MRGNETLRKVVDILQELDGYFTFSDGRGEEYIVARKKDAASLMGQANEPEVQLVLPPSPPTTVNTADELLDRINADIALYQEAQEQFDDLAIPSEETSASTEETVPLPPPRRVRFEPIRGDLPPELQE